MVIGFERPEAFLLAVPIVVALRGRLARRPLVWALRILLLLAVLAVIARPFRPGTEAGRDVVLVVDRSLSVPERHLATIREIAEHARRQREPGDRIGVVTFGRDAVVERLPSEDFGSLALDRPVDRQASNIAAALESATALIPPGRQGSVVLLSDGFSTGRDPAPAAREAVRRGIRVDAFPLMRTAAGDVAVEDVALPGEVAANEPFQWSGWIRSDRDVEVGLNVLRDGAVISSSKRQLHPGANRLVFRERLSEPGIHRFELHVDLRDDRTPENNRALGVVRVAGRQRILCLTPDGREDRLTRSLRAAGLDVVASAPDRAILDGPSLDPYRVVILENVPARRLAPGAMRNLKTWVEDFGGGLLMTGGRASFGMGGYRRSDVEKVLPVSLEVRQEQRKFALAMSIVLDRSGSMAAPVDGGGTKMDLADQGAAAALEVLGPQDSVSVLAVDTEPHVVIESTPVEDKASLTARILKIESTGGGIYVGVGIHAAADQLATAPQRNRHIVLFADAADSEEPDDVETFVPKLHESGVTVSVIGLGTEQDKDAELLKRIAADGGGRCFFTADAAELPRVFAEETIQVARSAVVDQVVACDLLPAMAGLGDFGGVPFPDLNGYSIAYARPRAQVGVTSRDDLKAPVLAFHQAGLGRAAAFLGEVDGELSGALSDWPRYADFFATIVRWLGGSDSTDDVFADFTRQGHEGVLRVEVTPGNEHRLAGVKARVADPAGAVSEVVLTRVGESALEARIPLGSEGIWRAIVEAGPDQLVRVPPIALPYSPEYEPAADPTAGEELLKRVCEAGGGRVQPPVAEIFSGSRESLGLTDLSAWCAWAALALLVLEIAVRRLQLSLPRIPAALGTKVGRWLRRSVAPPKPLTVARLPSPDDQPWTPPAASKPPSSSPADSNSAPAAASSTPDLGSALDRARRRAQKRR